MIIWKIIFFPFYVLYKMFQLIFKLGWKLLVGFVFFILFGIIILF